MLLMIISVLLINLPNIDRYMERKWSSAYASYTKQWTKFVEKSALSIVNMSVVV